MASVPPSAVRPTNLAPLPRLLARNLAIGLQLADADARPTPIREPAAFRAAHVDGLGTFVQDRQTILLTAPHAAPEQHYDLPCTHRTVRLVA